MTADLWQLCPRCDGQGHTYRPPWVPGDQPTWTSNTTGSHRCPPCNGTGLVRRPGNEEATDHDR